MPSLPPLSDLIKGRIYIVNCRNLQLAVFNGEIGFIGIRKKWNDRFLDTEDYYGPSSGTVRSAIDSGIDIPDHLISVLENPYGNKELFDFLDNVKIP